MTPRRRITGLLVAALLAYHHVAYAALLVLVTRRSATRCCSAAIARLRRDSRPARAAPAPEDAADGQPDRRRLRRGGGDRGQGRQRARARLPARTPGGDRRERRLGRRHGRRGAARRRRHRARARRAAARSARRTRPSRRSRAEIVAFSDANTQLGARRAARRSSRRSTTRPSATPAARCASSNDGGHEPGGPLLALRDGAARAGVRLASITAGNGAIYATRREAYIEVDPIMGHDLSFPFNMVKRGWRAVYVPQARATEKMVPSIEGEFARKRRMMSHAWPIVLRGGLLSPRGYPPLYALMIVSHRLLRYGAPFLHVGALVASLAARRSRAPFYAVALALQLALARRGAARASPAAAPAARRALLRPDDGVGRRRAVGLAAPRDPGRLGAGGGHALSMAPANLRRRRRRGRAAARVAGARARADRDPAGVARGARSTASGASAATAASSTCSSCARWSTGAEQIGAGLAVDAGDARITRVGALLRRTSIDELPNLVNVLQGRDGDRRPAPDAARAGRAVHRARARAPRRAARHHRLGAGQRARLAAVGRAHRARPLVHRAPLLAAGSEDPLAQRAARRRRRRALQGRTGGWRPR